jgi:hypothetical protein
MGLRGPKPGQGKKYGGRVKGTPNKINQTMSEKIIKACGGRDPVALMAEVAVTGTFPTLNRETGEWTYPPASEEVRTRCLTESSQYHAPKRRAVEHSGEIETNGGVLLVTGVSSPEDWLAGKSK